MLTSPGHAVLRIEMSKTQPSRVDTPSAREIAPAAVETTLRVIGAAAGVATCGSRPPSAIAGYAAVLAI
jgi:hypothetical protein